MDEPALERIAVALHSLSLEELMAPEEGAEPEQEEPTEQEAADAVLHSVKTLRRAQKGSDRTSSKAFDSAGSVALMLFVWHAFRLEVTRVVHDADATTEKCMRVVKAKMALPTRTSCPASRTSCAVCSARAARART